MRSALQRIWTTVLTSFLITASLRAWLWHLASHTPNRHFDLPASFVADVTLFAVVWVAVFGAIRGTSAVLSRFLGSREALLAILAFLSAYVTLIVFFALLYAQINVWEGGAAFSNHPNLIDLIYFSVITASTVGYGDFVPVSLAARAAVAVQVMCALVLVGVFLGSVAGLLKRPESGDEE